MHQLRLYLRSIPACAGEPCGAFAPSTLQAVYPRVCGGTRRTCIRSYTSMGLSPRVRGNLGEVDGELYRVRSIPACAGEPALAACTALSAPVYPRVCGGTVTGESCKIYAAGLSPRVRGNLTRPSRCGMIHRSIPACAGEPVRQIFSTWAISVYPRVCGGTGYRRHTHEPLQGLSPRVRGNHLPQSCPYPSTRSIPACAGEPARFRALPGKPRVYPRVCGGTRD